ncbi:hypothetical protein [Hanamia caeni]|jgi:hypothetical protein|nr:hypothetical protein [Hanamia caeni]
MTLTSQQQLKYLNEEIPYRLNSLMAWDLYFSRRRAKTYEQESENKKCYWESEFLQPAFEISIVFARSLIHFMGLGLKENKLVNFYSNKEDDVQIWDVIPGKQAYPLSILNSIEKQNLCNILKIANKSSAHLTLNFATDEEFASLIPGRRLVFRMVTEYVDNLNKSCLGWIE